MILETKNLEDESNEFENEFENELMELENSKQVDGWSMASLGRTMRTFGADDARVWSLGTRSETPATSVCDRRTCENTKEETNDNIVKKMWRS